MEPPPSPVLFRFKTITLVCMFRSYFPSGQVPRSLLVNVFTKSESGWVILSSSFFIDYPIVICNWSLTSNSFFLWINYTFQRMYRHRISSWYILWLHLSVQAYLRHSLWTIRQMLSFSINYENQLAEVKPLFNHFMVL